MNKIKITYKLSKKGQKDAFMYEQNSEVLQTLYMDADEKVLNLCDINDNGEAIIDARDIIYDYREVPDSLGKFHLEGVKEKEFDKLQSAEDIIKWIEECSESRERKLKAAEDIIAKKHSKIAKFNVIMCSIIILVLFVIINIIWKLPS